MLSAYDRIKETVLFDTSRESFIEEVVSQPIALTIVNTDIVLELIKVEYNCITSSDSVDVNN